MEAFKARSAAGYLYLPQPRSFGKGTDCIYVNLQTNKELSCGRVLILSTWQFARRNSLLEKARKQPAKTGKGRKDNAKATHEQIPIECTIYCIR